MRDIAAQAGVSYTTVSYVMNQRDSARGIGAETRQRVMETAAALGYRHNAVARAMVEGGQRVIGLLIQDPAVEFRAKILAGVIEEANRSGYLIKVFPLLQNSVPESILNTCLEQRLSGVIVVNVTTESLRHVHEEFSRYGVAIAMVDDVAPQGWGVRVVSDDVAGVHSALQHLWDLGHRRFGLLGGPPNSAVTQVRRGAYADFLTSREVKIGPIIDAASSWAFRPEDEAQLRSALGDLQRPTAIFCVSDYLAMRVLRIARSLGLDVPRDLSVVGYSDLSVAAYADPPLTTVVQRFRDMGALAARHIIARVERAKVESPQIQGATLQIYNEALNEILPTHLVVRASTAPPISIQRN